MGVIVGGLVNLPGYLEITDSARRRLGGSCLRNADQGGVLARKWRREIIPYSIVVKAMHQQPASR